MKFSHPVDEARFLERQKEILRAQATREEKNNLKNSLFGQLLSFLGISSVTRHGGDLLSVSLNINQ